MIYDEITKRYLVDESLAATSVETSGVDNEFLVLSIGGDGVAISSDEAAALVTVIVGWLRSERDDD
jgi:hypothetical protein